MKKTIQAILLTLVLLFGYQLTQAQQADSVDRTDLSQDIESILERLEELEGMFNHVDSNYSVFSGQLTEVSDDLSALGVTVGGLRSQMATISPKLQGLESETDSLERALNATDGSVSNLGQQISGVEQGLSAQRSELSEQDENLEKKIKGQALLTYGGYALALVLGFVVFGLARKESRSAVRDAQDAVGKRIDDSRKEMNEQILALDQELAAALIPQPITPAKSEDSELDHSLALKVADEITRIENNLAQMDNSIRGHKQLSRSVERVRENLLANGYELIAMLGKKYDENLLVEAAITTDETVPKGQSLITRVMRPEVRYDGHVIQTAKIQVKQGTA